MLFDFGNAPAVAYGGPRVIHTHVVSNRDTTGQGLVTVAIPWLGDVVAQVAVPMAGAQRGTWFMPQADDEVLVLLTPEPERLAYVIGSLWTSRDRPPRLGSEAPASQMIRTPGGQELVFDDHGSTVTLSTKQQRQEVRMSSTGIDIRVKAETGELRVSIGASGGIEISGNEITLKAQTKLSLSAAQLELTATGTCSISGKLVTIN